MYHLTILTKGFKTLLNKTAWLTELQDLNVCQSWKFLCNVLSLLWNTLYQGTINLNVVNYLTVY